ncbi:MAG TPA: Ig-like domain-containing protein [Flavisolibacter sp.]|nr:Ig-like domain-containing protein [Flavisolibacter sp.]
MVPPSGGPRDTLPPVLLSATPHDSTLNFKGNRIVLTFDEFVDLGDAQNNILVNPTFEHNPVIGTKLRTVTIRIRDSLTPNTTYTFNFGNSLKDFNEGNILRNFTYVMSTGPRIDSMHYSGKVFLAETGAVDTTLLVVLQKDLTDSAVMLKRPQYVTRVDNKGNFQFNNLPAGTFAIYALGDAGLSKKYQNKSSLFAFADKPVVIGSSAPDTLYAYREIIRITPGSGSTGTNAAATAKSTGTEKRLRFTTNAANSQVDLLKDLVITFPSALKSFDSSKINLTTDTSFNKVNYSASLDSTRKELTIKTTWLENTRYNLVLQKDFAQDSAGRQLLKADTVLLITKKRSDYSNSVRITLKNLDTARNPVLQFIQNNVVVFSTRLHSGVFTQELFSPGDYDLRILYDRNKNGKWDTGKFFGVRKQPEIAVPIEKKISIKPDFDNEIDIVL